MKLSKTVVVVGLASIPLALWLFGIAAVALWGWFMVPLGVPQIGKAHAYGLACLIALLTPGPPTDTKGESTDESALAKIFAAALRPAMFLFLGWIAAEVMAP